MKPTCCPHLVKEHRNSIERLEDRVAPAVLVNPTTVTYADTDGDLVTLKTSRGTFDLSANFDFVPVGPGEQLRTLQLTNLSEFGGAKISLTAKTAGGGNGTVDVGFIDASSIDLASVTIDGDLGRLHVGDSIVSTPALGTLKLGSFGSRGLVTQGLGASLDTLIHGRLGSLDVDGDFKEVHVTVTGDRNGSIGPVKIGGDILGGGAMDSGSIHASGKIGGVKIGGSLTGSGGGGSGRIDSGGDIASVTIAGNVTGVGAGSGAIEAERNIGPIVIRGNVVGGTGAESGSIQTVQGGNIASVSINGLFVGGGAIDSGAIQTNGGGNIGPVKIGTPTQASSIIGGAGLRSGSIFTDDGGSISSVMVYGMVIGGAGNESGSIYITDSGSIGSVRINAALFGGGGDGSGAILTHDNGSISSVFVGVDVIGGNGDDSGSIQTNDVGDLGAVKIGGRLLGGAGNNSGSVQAPDGAIKSVNVQSSVIGGDGDASGAIIASLQIGPVKITGGGELIGGAGINAGSIISKSGDISSVSVDGRVLGASGVSGYSGIIYAPNGTVKSVHIGADLVGGSTGAGEAGFMTGAIIGENIGIVRIDGSLIAGHKDGGLGLAGSGAIMANHHLESVSIGGNVLGSIDNFALISAVGQVSHGSTSDVAIGKVSIHGDSTFTNILAGFSSIGSSISADSQIGTVTVDGTWTAGNIAAGVQRTDAYYGNAGDKRIVGLYDTGIISRISKVVLRGGIAGTPAPGDSFGIVAEQVTSVVVNGSPIDLTGGASNDLVPVDTAVMTNDFHVLEVI